MSDFGSDNDVKDVQLFDADTDSNSFYLPSTSSKSTPLSMSNSRRPSSTTNDVSNAGSSMPLILTNGYFVVVDQLIATKHQKSANGVRALCQVCQKKICGSTKVTSNFLQHMKSKHAEVYQKYLAEKNRSDSTTRPNLRQRNTTPLTKCAKNEGHGNFDEKVLKFVVETGSPLSIVENPAFVSLFEGTHLKVDSQRHISDLLDTKYEEMVLEIISVISRTDYVCCTADIWSDGRKSIFGYTCHWIESNYKRKSAALACRRLSGSRNYSKIADIIREINTKYGITDKQLVCTITDNGRNCIKAFKEPGIRYTDGMHDEMSGDTEYGLYDGDTTFDSSPLIPQLSKHMRCASQTLSLLATVDFFKALHKTPVAYEKHQHSMKKCTEIWSKCKQSKPAKQLKYILSSSLKTPVMTQWNSFYDATKHLLSFSSKLADITSAFDIEDFELSEIEYLEEYCQLMQPIAQGLDFLLKEEDIYFGYLAPTLLTLKAKLSKFTTSPGTKYLKDVSKDMQDALINRFRLFFELQSTSHDAVIAAITCPAVKIMNCAKLLRIWKETAPNCTVSLLQDIFVKEVISSGPEADIRLEKRRSPELTAHPFFILEDSDEDESVQLQTDRSKKGIVIIEELRSFLENGDNTMSSLNHYPVIKQMFYEFNTALPSSTPVERLFSFAAMTDNHYRQDITDDHFEKLVIAKCNELIK